MKGLAALDDWLHADERSVLDGFAAVVDALKSPVPDPDRPLQPEIARELVAAVRAAGWLEFGYAAEVAGTLRIEAAKRLHQRLVPVAAPLLEVWAAGYALALVAADSPEAADVLAALSDGTGAYGGGVQLAIDDLFRPAPATGEVTTGWLPFAEVVPVLLPLRHPSGVRLHLVLPGTGTPLPAVNPDPTIVAARLALPDPAGLPVLGELDDGQLTEVQAYVLAAQAAALVGQARALFAATVEFLRTREQFGRPVGSFQALKHRAADLVTELHAANLVSGHVAVKLGQPAEIADPLMLGHLAKAICGRVALMVASEAVQLHGGMGFTWEGGIHFGLKRAAYLAMAGRSIGECEMALGEWAISAQELAWAGGTD